MHPDPLIGQVIDQRYQVRSLLGKGGMGRVYRVNQVAVDREVALKCIAPEHLQNAVAVGRFKREAAIIAKLRHPHTLKLLDVGALPGGGLYIVSPLLVGSPLDELLAKEGPLDVLRVLRLMEQTLASLSEAHAEGIVHRDLKPGNLFIEQLHDEEYVKVLDFGIARLVTAETALTKESTSPGTPWYMSPEQVRGDTNIDGRSDLYALGCLAFECLVGRAPFTADHALAVAIKHLSEAPPSLAEVQPSHRVPPEVETLLMWCLEKDPALRPADARALRKAIKPLLHQLEAQGIAPFETADGLTLTSNVSVPVFTRPEIPAVEQPLGPNKLRWFVLALLVLGAASPFVYSSLSSSDGPTMSDAQVISTNRPDASLDLAQVDAQIPSRLVARATPDMGQMPTRPAMPTSPPSTTVVADKEADQAKADRAKAARAKAARAKAARVAEVEAARVAEVEAARIEAARVAEVEAARIEAARVARVEAARIKARRGRVLGGEL